MIVVVPPGVLINVGTVSVTEPEPVTELGDSMHVTPVGHPEVTERFTVAVRVEEYVIVRVYVANAPAPTLWDDVVATIVKSLAGGGGGPPLLSVKVVEPLVPSICRSNTVEPSDVYAEAGAVKLAVQRAIPLLILNSSSQPFK